MASEGLKKWFGRNQGRGWVDLQSKRAAGVVPCGRKSAKQPPVFFLDFLIEIMSKNPKSAMRQAQRKAKQEVSNAVVPLRELTESRWS